MKLFIIGLFLTLTSIVTVQANRTCEVSIDGEKVTYSMTRSNGSFFIESDNALGLPPLTVQLAPVEYGNYKPFPLPRLFMLKKSRYYTNNGFEWITVNIRVDPNYIKTIQFVDYPFYDPYFGDGVEMECQNKAPADYQWQ